MVHHAKHIRVVPLFYNFAIYKSDRYLRWQRLLPYPSEGYAFEYHSHPRATNDTDVWIAIHPDYAQRVVNALKELTDTTKTRIAALVKKAVR